LIRVIKLQGNIRLQKKKQKQNFLVLEQAAGEIYCLIACYLTIYFGSPAEVPPKQKGG